MGQGEGPYSPSHSPAATLALNNISDFSFHFPCKYLMECEKKWDKYEYIQVTSDQNIFKIVFIYKKKKKC